MVAVSGGIDSVCLLHALLKLRHFFHFELFVAHFNHRMRTESAADEKFVKKLALKYGLPFYSQKAKRILKNEAQARQGRYQFFVKAKKHFRADSVATAHTATDQLETIIIFILRGSNIHGLAGIPYHRDFYIRPLLDCQRQEIKRYVKTNHLTWHEDQTNKDFKYLRNRIRWQIIPALEKTYPRLLKELEKNIGYFQKVSGFLDKRGKLLFRKALTKDIVSRPQKIVWLNRSFLAKLNPIWQKEVFRQALLYLSSKGLQNLTTKHYQALINALRKHKTSGEVNLPGGLRFMFGYDKIAISRQAQRFSLKPFKLLLPGKTKIPIFGLEIEIKKGRNCAPAKPTINQAIFNQAKTGKELFLRVWQNGDEIHLQKVGTKKLQDYFVDRKIPKPKRGRIPLLVNARNKVIWIVGERADYKFLATTNSKNNFQVKITSL